MEASSGESVLESLQRGLLHLHFATQLMFYLWPDKECLDGQP